MFFNKIFVAGTVYGKSQKNEYTNSKGEKSLLVSFSIATKKQKARKEDELFYIKVTCFGSTAKYVDSFVINNQKPKVFVEGTLNKEVYTDKNGVKKENFSIIADTVLLTESAKKEGIGYLIPAEEEEEVSKPEGDIDLIKLDENDLPF